MGVQDLLGAILGEGANNAQGSDLDDLVGGLLDGLGGAQQSGGQQTGGLLGGLLGGILGGGQSAGSQSGGLGGILGGILGGGQQHPASGMANNPLMAGIADALTEKLGVSPQVAQGIVAFAIAKLLPLLLDQVQGRSQATAAGAAAGAAPGLDLDDLLGRMSGHQGLDHGFLAQSGLAADLSAQTGLDEDTAEEGLRQTLFMLGDVVGGTAQAKQDQEGLDDLLDNWQ